MSSVGIGLKPFIDKKLLLIRSERPTFTGLEMHLVDIMKLVNTFKPQVVVMDPVTNLIAAGLAPDVKAVLTRLIDFLKIGQVTTLLASLTTGGNPTERTDMGVSSLMDTWVVLKDIEGEGEHNRGISIVKSRGMAHSNQFREFRLTGKGFALEDVSLGEFGGLTGAARAEQEAKEVALSLARTQEMARMKKLIERKRALLDARIASLQGDFEAKEEEIRKSIEETETVEQERRTRKIRVAGLRQADKKGGGMKKEPAESEKEWELRLYVAGQTPKSLAAFANLKRICEEHLAGKYRIEVIDLVQNPALAAGDQIIAIPTLVRKLPEPIRKIIGDLSNTERVLVGLDLRPVEEGRRQA